MDSTQAIFLSVIVVLGIFLAVIGFQVFFVLRDFRKTLKKLDKILVDAEDVVINIKKPLESIGNLFTAVTAGAGIAHIIKKLTSGDDKK
jgi:nucleosome binding factor SPN SPT16 subunit